MVIAVVCSVEALSVHMRRSRTAVAPLERLKILMQIQGGDSKRYSSVFQGLKHIAKTEGIAGMMRGNLTNCIRIVPNQAVGRFTTSIINFQHQFSALSGLPIVGPALYIIQQQLVFPTQVKFLCYEQFSRILSHRMLEVRKQSPVGNSTSGCHIDLVPIPAGYIWVRCMQNGGDGQMTPLLRLSAGACAGIIGMSATYPLDMVRGRLTIQVSTYALSTHQKLCASLRVTSAIVSSVRLQLPSVGCYCGCVLFCVYPSNCRCPGCRRAQGRECTLVSGMPLPPSSDRCQRAPHSFFVFNIV